MRPRPCGGSLTASPNQNVAGNEHGEARPVPQLQFPLQFQTVQERSDKTEHSR
jgi:hypothetical protein